MVDRRPLVYTAGGFAELPSGDTVPLDPRVEALLTPVSRSASGTASVGEMTRADLSSAAWTLTLPAAPADKSRVGWKITAQAATPNTLSVTCGGSDRFNTSTGLATFPYSPLGHSAIVQYDAASGSWLVQSGDLPLSQLDARYILATARDAVVLDAVGQALVLQMIGL